MRILLTGASGFVGKRLAETLRPHHEVITLGRQGADVQADLSAPLAAGVLPGRLDAVIHAAAVIDVRDAPIAERVNVDATLALARHARAAGAQQFVFFSTGGVYAPRHAAFDEEAPLGPIGPYAQAKLRAEEGLRPLATGIEVKVLRLFFPYGVGQAPQRLLPRLVASIRRGEAIRLGDAEGGPRLTPIHIDDVAQFTRRVLAVEGGFIANIAGNEATSIKEMSELIGDTLGGPPRFVLPAEAPAAPAAPAHWCASNARLRALCGFEPTIALRDGIAAVARAAALEQA